jgi:hypothetical protein
MIVAAAFPAGEERRGGRESNCGLGLVQWKRNSVNEAREESQHHEPQNPGAGASAGSGSHARALHLPLQPAPTPQLQKPLQRLSRLHPASSSISKRHSHPRHTGAALISLLHSLRASRMLGERRLPNLFPPPTALLCNRAAAGQSMRGLGNKDCLDHRAARAAARETFQDETRLEQRFRVAPCGEKALLEARAAIIGCVRFCTPPALVLLCIFRPNHGCVRPSSPPHAIMRDARTGERVGCYVQYSTCTAWDATSLSLIP